MNRVFLYTGGVTRAHPIHKEASRYPPEGFTYTPDEAAFFRPAPSPAARAPWAARLLPPLTRATLATARLLRLPKVRMIQVPDGTALIHSAQYPLLNRTPWVMDFEHVGTLAWYDRNALDASSLRSFFEWLFARDACRGLLAWTTAAAESMRRTLRCDAFAKKIHVVHHTIIPQPHVDRTARHGPIRLLYCSRNFLHKGGYDAVAVADRLSRDLDIHLTVVSEAPAEVLARYGDHPRMTFHRRLPPEERHRLLQATDLLLHPAHAETYGYVMVEAFSFGIPVVTTTGFSGPELVGNGERGIAVENPLSWYGDDLLPRFRTAAEVVTFEASLREPPTAYLDHLAAATAELVMDHDRRHRMSAAAFQSVADGMFSPQRHREVLGEIYRAALGVHEPVSV